MRKRLVEVFPAYLFAKTYIVLFSHILYTEAQVEDGGLTSTIIGTIQSQVDKMRPFAQFGDDFTLNKLLRSRLPDDL
jgi:hypothetical protein